MRTGKVFWVLLFCLLSLSITVYSRTLTGDLVIVTWHVDVDSDGKVILLPQARILVETAKSTTLRIRLENNYKAWYEVLVKPIGPIINASSLPTNFILSPGGRKDFDSVTFGSGDSLGFVADGTSSIAQTFLIVDLLWRLFVGSPFPQNLCDLLLQNMDILLPIAGFVADLSLDIQNRDIPEILLDLGRIPTIPQIPQVLKAIALMGGNELAAKKIDKVASGLIPWLKIMLRAEKIVELELLTLLAPRADALVFGATLIKRRPQPPDNLKATAISSANIELDWQDNSNNEDSFKIYRDGAFISQVEKDQTTFTDTGLQPLTRYCYQVSAFNSAGESRLSNRACAITLPKPNHPPIANAGPEQTVLVNSTVQLDGSGSSDPDGDALKYRWKFIKKPSGSKARVSNSNIAKPTFKADKAGEYILELEVDDGRGGKATDQVKIMVQIDIAPPALITNFQASDSEDSQSTLTWTNPSDSDLAQVIVKRKTTGYPANHDDGETRLTIDSATAGRAETFVDTGLTNDTTYYYAVFSRDKAGNWNDQVVGGKNADTGRPQGHVVLTHPWPMFQHDAQHTGRSPAIGPAVSENSSVKLLIPDTGGVPLVVIDTNNNLYFLGNLNNQHGLYAFDSKGEQKWVFQPNCEGYPYFTSSPTLGPDEAIYCACKETILAIDPTGKLMWQKTLSGYTFSHSPLVSSSGTIYLLGEGQTSKRLFALNTEGEILWFYEILMDLGPWRVDPALNPTGDTIYIGYGAYLFAVNNLGVEIWQRKFWAIDLHGNQVDEAAVSGISIGGDGTIYVVVTHEKEWQTLTDGGWSAGLHALDPNDPHQERWVQYARSFLGPAAIGREGTIYVAGGWTDWLGSWRPVLYAFDSQGNPLPNWPISLGSGIGMAELLLVDRSEIVYAFTNYGYLKALDQEGNERLSVALGQGSGPLSMGGDGTLYVPTRNALYAVGSSDNNPPSATEVSEELQISSIQNVPNPGSGAKMKFLVKGQAIKNIQLQIFDLSGRPVFNTNWLEGNTFEWHLNNNKGEVLANGVYLYVITVRGWDGTILRNEVKKLVILR